MTAHHVSVPTLTEVIEVVPDGPAQSAPMPLAPDSVPMDLAAPSPPAVLAAIPRLSLWGEPDPARLVDDVVAQLQPALEAWVQERLAEGLQQALQDSLRPSIEAAVSQAVQAATQSLDAALRAGVEQAGADLARRLRTELPSLARAALEATRADTFGR